MDSVVQTLGLWEDEAFIVLAALVAVCIYSFASKVWSGSKNLSLALLLGMGLIAVAVAFFAFQVRARAFINPRALLYLLLYAWAALGLLFLAGRQTSALKLVLGLTAEGGIIFALYRYL